MKKEKSISPEEYKEILKDLKLNSIHLKESSFSINRDAFLKER